MLDQKTIQVIQSTAPVLETVGEQITTRFYEQLFADHPELYNLFNVVHQKKKSQQQALAQAVYQAAVHVDRLPELLPHLERVFQKHRSLGVQAEHYPIVGKYLLFAIKDVLGDAATDEIVEAWDKLYQVLADVFISQESARYQQSESKFGGWSGWREFIVERKVPESQVITSFYLVSADGKPLAEYQPGQYISLKTYISSLQVDQIRQYSLSDAPGKPYYRISVKREDAKGEHPAGMVSSYLHHSVSEGDSVWISAPAGDFVLNPAPQKPVVLISGGVGLTPIMSMFNQLLIKQDHQAVTYIHAAINGDVHAFREYVQTQAELHSHITTYTCYEQPTDKDRKQQRFVKEGFVDLAWLRQIMPTDADVYFCGPPPFMRTIKQALEAMEVPSENIHYEFFGPAQPLAI